MGILTREQILRPKLHKVPVEGGEILIRSFNVEALDLFMEVKEGLKGAKVYTLLFGLSVCDEEGKLLFTPEDESIISKMSFALILEVGNAVMKLNKLDKPAEGEQVPN